MSSRVESSGGIGLLGCLFLIFLTLKLTGHIDWSWWWVTAPLWGPFALIGVVFGVLFVFWCLFAGAASLLGRKQKFNKKS